MRHLIRRAGWGVGDQAVWSATNFGLGILVARTVGPEGFGAFSIVFATYLIVLAVARALATEPLVVRYSGADVERWREGAAQAAAVSLRTGLVCAAGCAVGGVLIGGDVGEGLLALAPALPGLLVQDAWRLALFTAGDARRAALNDTLRAGLLFAGLVPLAFLAIPRIGWFVLAWGGAATIAAVAGAAQVGARPRLRTGGWLRSHRDLAPRFLVEAGSSTGAQQLGLFGVGAVAGLRELGAFRGGWMIFGPLQILYSGIHLVALPEAARRWAAGQDLRRPCVALSSGLAVVALVVGAGLLLVPDATGTAVMGETWLAARVVLAPLTLALAGAGAFTGALIGLRALAAARRSMRARLVLSVVILACEIGGAAAAGARGAAWGSAAGLWFGTAWWWWEFTRARADSAGARQAPGPSASHGPPLADQ